MIASSSDFGGGEERRPRLPDTASISGKENSPMIAIAETFARLTDALERLTEIAEREYGGREEAREESSQRMLSPEEASKVMNIHAQTVTAWCRNGRLQAFKIGGNEANGRGGKWLIPREAIDAYLHRQQVIHGTKKGGAK
jgi:excisionase family DNA binding protein